MKKKWLTKGNRQLIGFVLLLSVFALLLYTSFLLFSEGLFKESNENKTAISKQSNELTKISIIYKKANSTNLS
ncbi:MAG: hypothetical protein NZ903_03340 [Candidatus Micrarchaeota archaeon]|nr:hypothetical protein [Candidatus Micrarchaeota archaeon]